MAQAEFHEILPVDREKLFQVITSYENYPEFVEGVTEVEVEPLEDSKSGNQLIKKSRATYHINMMSKDFSYTLDHVEDSKAGVVKWDLIESTLFKKNVGRWQLQEAGKGKTDVLYQLEVEFKIPVPGFILNRLVKSSLPGMIKSFQDKALAKGT